MPILRQTSKRKRKRWQTFYRGAGAIACSFIVNITWLTVISFFHSNPFGIKDPLFNKDISFYIFNLPFFEIVYNLLVVMITLTLMIVGILYILFSFNQGPLNWIQFLSQQT